MKFTALKIPGVFLIETEPINDERGFFTRTFCRNEFVRNNLNPDIIQTNLSFNHQKGTIRGIHYQIPPAEETKVVSCIKGSIFDVIVDLRSNSSTYKSWIGIEIGESKCKSIYIPTGCAHGFQTTEEKTLVFYQMGNFFKPECARGIRWDDPALGIKWPLPVTNISEKDRNY